jgi:AraC family transcriptional regulator
MSRTNFIRHFRRETGQTFHDYVTAQRMEEAERLLREGEWSLSFIRQFIGLRPTQFLTQFKKHTGLTPAEFRRRYIKKHKTDES